MSKCKIKSGAALWCMVSAVIAIVLMSIVGLGQQERLVDLQTDWAKMTDQWRVLRPALQVPSTWLRTISDAWFFLFLWRPRRSQKPHQILSFLFAAACIGLFVWHCIDCAARGMSAVLWNQYTLYKLIQGLGAPVCFLWCWQHTAQVIPSADPWRSPALPAWNKTQRSAAGTCFTAGFLLWYFWNHALAEPRSWAPWLLVQLLPIPIACLSHFLTQRKTPPDMDIEA